MEKMSIMDTLNKVWNVVYNILVVIGILTIIAGFITVMVLHPAQVGAIIVGLFLFCCVCLAIMWIVTC